MNRKQEKAMFKKRRGHLHRTFEQDVEKEVRIALAKKYHGIRKTKAGKIRVGFDNAKHVDISITEKQP